MQDFWKHFWGQFLVFLALFAGGLTIGGLFTSAGVNSDWYQNAIQAPWTPPGWVFGAAWTSIMICFSIYMSRLTKISNLSSINILFGIQVILNIAWNYLFFNQQLVLIGLFEIIVLTLLIITMFFLYFRYLSWYSFLIAPYMIWLCIATSLNAYVYLYN